METMKIQQWLFDGPGLILTGAVVLVLALCLVAGGIFLIIKGCEFLN